MFGLQGKKAVVTGENIGLGLGSTGALCEAGAEVVVLTSSLDVESPTSSWCLA